MSNKNVTLKDVVARAQREIIDHVGAGVVPATVASFGELHDYVDANGYGGAFEEPPIADIAWRQGSRYPRRAVASQGSGLEDASGPIFVIRYSLPAFGET